MASQHDEDLGASVNPQQRRVYQRFIGHIEPTQDSRSHRAPARFLDSILIQVDGQTGTSKSFLIRVSVVKLGQLLLMVMMITDEGGPCGDAALAGFR